MRAQLSVIALIVFGAGLVALGLIRFPYTSVEEDNAVVQTFSTGILTVVETGTTVITDIQTSTATAATSVQRIETHTTTYITSVTAVLEVLEERLAGPDTPLVLGPYSLGVGEVLRVLWTADRVLDVYLTTSNSSPPSSWVALAEGSVGNLSYSPNEAGAVYVSLYTVEPNTLVTSVEVSRMTYSPTVETLTRTATITTTQTYTTTYPVYETKEVTTSRLETTRIPFTTSVRTTVTETRYSDVSFTAFMGSFIIFTGVLLMVLLVKTMPKPAEVNRPAQ